MTWLILQAIIKGSLVKDVHTKGEGSYQKWTDVDTGRGYLSYSGRPQAVPLYQPFWQFTSAQQYHSKKWLTYAQVVKCTIPSFCSADRAILVFSIQMVATLINISVRNRPSLTCTDYTGYRYWCLMTWHCAEMQPYELWLYTRGMTRDLVKVDIGGYRGGVKNATILWTSFMDGLQTDVGHLMCTADFSLSWQKKFQCSCSRYRYQNRDCWLWHNVSIKPS